MSGRGSGANRERPLAKPPSLRVAGGQHRGRRLVVPESIRPTQEQVREALFSRWRSRVPGAVLLELFCGSGAVSIEALSRGAEAAFLVDSDQRAVDCARRNLEALELSAHCVPLEFPDQWSRRPTRWPQTFDLIFVDPPYDFPQLEHAVEVAASVLGPVGELALEHSRRRTLIAPDSVEIVDRRTYGESALSFVRRLTD